MGRPTADEIKGLRDRMGIGIYEAKRILERDYLLKDIDALECGDDLKSILRRLV